MSDIHPAATAAFPYVWRKLSTGDPFVPLTSVLLAFVPSFSSELSLSHDPNARGVPGPFVLPIREIRARFAIISSPSPNQRPHPFLQRWRWISVSARRRHVRARLHFVPPLHLTLPSGPPFPDFPPAQLSSTWTSTLKRTQCRVCSNCFSRRRWSGLA